jgi:hypothetical protein
VSVKISGSARPRYRSLARVEGARLLRSFEIRPSFKTVALGQNAALWEREAFCSHGCHTSFYLKRCLVCEEPIQRRNKTQRVCQKRQCRSAWRAKAGFGRCSLATSVSSASKVPGFIGSKQPLSSDRAWRQIAGPKLSASQLHCGLVSAEEAVAEDYQKNRPYWRRHNTKALIQPHHPPLNILGGINFPMSQM